MRSNQAAILSADTLSLEAVYPDPSTAAASIAEKVPSGYPFKNMGQLIELRAVLARALESIIDQRDIRERLQEFAQLLESAFRVEHAGVDIANKAHSGRCGDPNGSRDRVAGLLPQIAATMPKGPRGSSSGLPIDRVRQHTGIGKAYRKIGKHNQATDRKGFYPLLQE